MDLACVSPQAFDDLLLMKAGGMITYHGHLGKRSHSLVAYFEVSYRLADDLQSTIDAPSALFGVMHRLHAQKQTIAIPASDCRNAYVLNTDVMEFGRTGNPGRAEAGGRAEPSNMDAANQHTWHGGRPGHRLQRAVPQQQAVPVRVLPPLKFSLEC